MKKIIFILGITIGTISVHSQVIIGDEVGTATNKTSVLLEFSKNENRGIILPYVKTLPTNPTPGTILLDATTPTTAKVKYFNGAWVDLSGQNGDVSALLSLQNAASEPTNIQDAKVIIGDSQSTADGVLILESNNKAMVLPIVKSVDDIVSPSAGMMVYVSNSLGVKRLAVYNGAKWSFWATNQ